MRRRGYEYWAGSELSLLSLVVGIVALVGALIPGSLLRKSLISVILLVVLTWIIGRYHQVIAKFVMTIISIEPRVLPVTGLACLAAMFVASVAILRRSSAPDNLLLSMTVAALVSAGLTFVEIAIRVRHTKLIPWRASPFLWARLALDAFAGGAAMALVHSWANYARLANLLPGDARSSSWLMGALVGILSSALLRSRLAAVRLGGREVSIGPRALVDRINELLDRRINMEVSVALSEWLHDEALPMLSQLTVEEIAQRTKEYLQQRSDRPAVETSNDSAFIEAVVYDSAAEEDKLLVLLALLHSRVGYYGVHQLITMAGLQPGIDARQPQASSLERFAADLRELRQCASISYRQMEEQVHYSASTLAKAARGTRLPTLRVTLAYVEACGGNLTEWEARWHAVAASGPPHGPSGGPMGSSSRP